MPRRKRHTEPLPTIWRAVPCRPTSRAVPDDLWDKVKLVLAQSDPPKRKGRKRINAREALNAIIYRLRSGVQWNQLPKEFPDDSSVHRTFQRWVRLGIIDEIWALVVTDCDELGGVDWEWQSADAALGKARLGGPCWPQPDGSWEERRETQPVGRVQRRSARCRGGWRQCAGRGTAPRFSGRYQAAGPDAGRHRGRAPAADPGDAATLVLGQRLRQSDGAAGGS